MTPEREIIVVIEDDDSIREDIVQILQLKGYEVFAANDAEEGLPLIFQTSPSIVLCDIRLPGRDGFSVLDAVRENPDTSTIPFIFLTALNSISSIREGMGRGAHDYITKPFKIDDMISAIHARLANKVREKQERLAGMHDHLGAVLADLDFLVRRLKPGTIDARTCEELRRLSGQGLNAYRDSLSEDEDNRLLREKSFSAGLHLILLRRYTIFDRSLDFQADSGVEELESDHYGHVRQGLYRVLREAVTNDLKYGRGEATVRLQNDRGSIRVQLRSQTQYAADRDSTGRGSSQIERRVRALGGEMEIERADSVFTLNIRIPLEKSTA